MGIHSRKVRDPDWELDIEFDEDIEMGLEFEEPEDVDKMEVDWDDKESRKPPIW